MERCRRENKKGKVESARQQVRERESQADSQLALPRDGERSEQGIHLWRPRVCVCACVRACERQQCEIKGGGEMNTEEETEEECSGAQQQSG